MTQFPYTPAGLPGGAAQPWIVVRPGSFSRVVAQMRGSKFLRPVHTAGLMLFVLVFVPARAVDRSAGPLAAAGFVAAAALLVGLLTWQVRTMRVEWDGRSVIFRTAMRTTTIGTPGVGQIVRASLVSKVALGYTQYWLDASGRAVGRLPETQWDPVQLGRIAEQAHIPVVNIGLVTPREFSERYPKIRHLATGA
jgi:hypothetical protein